MIVVITDEAEADLERIGDMIAQNDPRRAVSFTEELVERCNRLVDFPERFQRVPRHEASVFVAGLTAIISSSIELVQTRSMCCTC